MRLRIIFFRFFITVCTASLLAAGLSGCLEPLGGSSSVAGGSSETSSEPAAEYPVTVAGVTVAEAPARMVSLSPGLTDLCGALGAGDRLVGLSDYCDLPSGADEGLPRVGTAANLDLEALLALEPQLVVTASELSIGDRVALAQAGVQVLWLPLLPDADPTGSMSFAETGTAAEVAAALCRPYLGLAQALLGDVTGTARAEEMSEQMRAQMEALDALGAVGRDPRPSAALLLEILGGEGMLLAAPADSTWMRLLGRAGLRDALESSAYGVTAETLAQADPTFLLLPIRSGLSALDAAPWTPERARTDARFSSLPAAEAGRVLCADVSKLERGGRQMLEELLRLAREALGA